MVRTRSGNEVIHTEASYGRAAKAESIRRMKKRKLLASLGHDEDDANVTTTTTTTTATINLHATPRRTLKTRAQIQELEDLSTPPSATTRVAITPPATNKRLLRGQVPRCSDFGLLRHFAFKGGGFFFCSPCDLWDARLPDCSKNMSGDSRRYACTAGHIEFSHPTSLLDDRKKKHDDSQTTAAIASSSMSSSDDWCSSSNGTSSSTDGEEECCDKDEESCEEEASTEDEQVTSNIAIPVNVSGSIPLDQSPPEVSAVGRSSSTRSDADKRLIAILQGRVVKLQQRNAQTIRTNKKLRATLEMLRGTGGDAATAANDDNGNNLTDPTSWRTKNESFKIQVTEAINSILMMHNRWSLKRKVTLVARAVWAFDGTLPELLILSRKYFRNNVFTPFKVLKEMDLAGGTLSYEGIDVIRRVETGGIKGFRGSMIPSKSEIKRMAGVVEWFARPICPYTVKLTSTGEAVQFDNAKALMCIIKAFHLDTIGQQRSLSVASSIDGASLSKNLSIVAAGIKVIDQAALCPLTKKPLLDNPVTMKAQSRRLNIPTYITLGRETKEKFQEFGPFFKFFDNISEVDTLPAEFDGFKPFESVTTCDLSALWKGLCKGGATKVHKYPCTGCATTSECLATPNATLCTRWCYEHSLLDPEWLCYHKPMATPEHVISMRSQVAELISTLNCAYEEIQADSKMTQHDVEVEEPLLSSKADAASIHFLPTTDHERRQYSQLLRNELMLRGLDISGTVDVRRETLRSALHHEAMISRLGTEIDHGEVKEGAYFLLMHTIPCVLHMENRIGIKLLTMVLIEGLSNAKTQNACMYPDINAEGRRVSQFVADIEGIINRSILGSDDDPCQWMCPFDTKKKEMGPITMDNVRTRRVVDSLDTLVAFCVKDPVRASLWTKALDNYRTAMVLLRKKNDFTNTEVASYQKHADKFFQAWVNLWQLEGITNYIHMIGSGHIAEYLFKWKNLYRYSQQGWEALNSLIKTFFFRRTNHGGGVRGDSKKSRLIPIGRWLQRRLIFLCRYDESSIRQYVEENPMPPVFRTQQAISIEDDDDDDDIYE